MKTLVVMRELQPSVRLNAMKSEDINNSNHRNWWFKEEYVRTAMTKKTLERAKRLRIIVRYLVVLLLVVHVGLFKHSNPHHNNSSFPLGFLWGQNTLVCLTSTRNTLISSNYRNKSTETEITVRCNFKLRITIVRISLNQKSLMIARWTLRMLKGMIMMLI